MRSARGILAPPTASSRRGVGTLRHASVSACHRNVGQRHGSLTRWTYASTNPGKDRQPAQINHLPARPSRRPWTDPDCARHHHRATRRARVPAHTRRDDLSMTQVPNVYRSHSLFQRRSRTPNDRRVRISIAPIAPRSRGSLGFRRRRRAESEGLDPPIGAALTRPTVERCPRCKRYCNCKCNCNRILPPPVEQGNPRVLRPNPVPRATPCLIPAVIPVSKR